jgi:hypothetical protein
MTDNVIPFPAPDARDEQAWSAIIERFVSQGIPRKKIEFMVAEYRKRLEVISKQGPYDLRIDLNASPEEVRARVQAIVHEAQGAALMEMFLLAGELYEALHRY